MLHCFRSNSKCKEILHFCKVVKSLTGLMFRIAELLVKEALCCADGGDSEYLAFLPQEPQGDPTPLGLRFEIHYK